MSRNPKFRSIERGNRATPEVSIPDKVYFRIGEVSQLAQTKPYVLRYWETEFPTLRPTKTRTGHRLYRRKDVETILEIKRLLYEEGFTIDGARKQLAATSKSNSTSPEQKSLFHTRSDGVELRLIERELRNILTMLSRKTTVKSDE
jgi:DNA-binding transcriptional MerR regulator